MSVTVRLTKTGRKNAPSYRIIATKTRTKRDGKAIEILGFFNPSHNPPQFALKKERLAYWQKVGARVSVAVQKLAQGEYQFVKYSPKTKSKE